MRTASALDAEVARQTETSKRQRALLDRVFALAQASLDRFSPARAAAGCRAGARRGASAD